MTSEAQVQAEAEPSAPALPLSEPPATAPTAPATAGTPEQPLSKNAQKKLARAARIAEQKKERRAYEKEKKKEKRRQQAAKRAAGELDDGSADAGAAPRKKARVEGPRTPFDARIVVDLGFDDMMNENEVKSLTGQLAYTYNAQKKAKNPFSALLFTSLNGRTFTRLESMSDAAYKRWKDTEWWQESYEKLWEGDAAGSSTESEPANPVEQSGDGVENKPKISKNPQVASRESVVYLTADSSDELSELKEGETYIIGGICDHNRYKNLCFNKAQASQIRTARLPIGTYLAELKTRKVLTVNQTFEILLKWVETRDWREAFESIIPKRKFHESGRARRRGGVEYGSEQAEDEDERADFDDESRKVIVDAAAVLGDEDAMDGEDVDAEGDVEEAGGDMGSLVVAVPDSLETNENGPAVSMDDAHPEVPS